jgi:hypothetical protein
MTGWHFSDWHQASVQAREWAREIGAPICVMRGDGGWMVLTEEDKVKVEQLADYVDDLKFSIEIEKRKYKDIRGREATFKDRFTWAGVLAAIHDQQTEYEATLREAQHLLNEAKDFPPWPPQVESSDGCLSCCGRFPTDVLSHGPGGMIEAHAVPVEDEDELTF